jgi:hypothetical protein
LEPPSDHKLRAGAWLKAGAKVSNLPRSGLAVPEPVGREDRNVRLSVAKALVVLSGMLALFGAGACLHAGRLDAAAGLKAADAREAGAAFASSFAGNHQDSELKLLDERRHLVLRGALWSRAGLLAFGLAILSTLAAWLARELQSFNTAIVEAGSSGSGVRAEPPVGPSPPG